MILYLIVGGVIGVITTAAVWLVGHSFVLDAVAYAMVDAVNWPGGFCRRDIGWRALQAEAIR